MTALRNSVVSLAALCGAAGVLLFAAKSCQQAAAEGTASVVLFASDQGASGPETSGAFF
jgi:hypothetical protein